jgi:hypothetical protein
MIPKTVVAIIAFINPNPLRGICYSLILKRS